MAISPRPKAGQTGNWLLDRLSGVDFKPLAPAMECVCLPARQTVFHPEDLVQRLCFPVSTVLTLMVGESSVDGRGLEFSSVGKEGMAGFTALLGVPTNLHRVVCHTPGDCWLLPTPVLAEAMTRRRTIDALIKHYMAFAYRTAAQAVVCNALHSVEQRVCRWLLAAQEKGDGEIPATQDLLTALLGVKRPTISLVANSLQKAGLISYHRGTVRIVDLSALEQSACACHRLTKGIYERIFEQ